MTALKLGDRVSTKFGDGNITLLPPPGKDGIQRVHVTCDNKSCYDFAESEVAPVTAAPAEVSPPQPEKTISPELAGAHA